MRQVSILRLLWFCWKERMIGGVPLDAKSTLWSKWSIAVRAVYVLYFADEMSVDRSHVCLFVCFQCINMIPLFYVLWVYTVQWCVVDEYMNFTCWWVRASLPVALSITHYLRSIFTSLSSLKSRVSRQFINEFSVIALMLISLFLYPLISHATVSCCFFFVPAMNMCMYRDRVSLSSSRQSICTLY